MGKDKASRRHRALHEEINSSEAVRPSKRKAKERSRLDGDDEYVSDKQTQRILSEARKQQEEVEEEEYGIKAPTAKRRGKPGARESAAQAPSLRLGGDEDEEESEDDTEFLRDGKDDVYDPVMVTVEEEKAFALFMNPNKPSRRTLGEIISAKLEEKKTEIATMRSDMMSEMTRTQPGAGVHPEMAQLFQKIGEILSKYRSGSLPKALKMVPRMANWEEILFLTNPETWSAAAMYQATRIFSSNLTAALAQHFYNLILLPRLRDDIAEYRRLNFHLYMALKKSVFKSTAFFKGIVMPLCEDGDCTLREALIVGSVISKSSIPMLQASTAIMLIADMPYSGACSIFLRILFDKKYALPYRVIDSVVSHFVRFEMDDRELPVLWHQSLLSFVTRYKEDISSEQKSALYELLQKHSHGGVTPDIRRELVYSKSRDTEQASVAAAMEL